LLITTESSLEDLNRRMIERGKQPIPMSRFRPNIVIAGTEAWAEDHWLEVEIGSMRFDLVKPCARCTITTVEPSHRPDCGSSRTAGNLESIPSQ
jgi:uncharacterized protein YcbX